MTTRTLIDRSIFFDNPEISSASLSPDGKMMSFLKAKNGIMNVFVKDIDAPFELARPLTSNKSPILGYFWSYDSKYVLYSNDKNGDENLNIYRVDPNGKIEGDDVPLSFNLTPMKDVAVQIYKMSKLDPSKMWIGINDRDKAWHDLYLLSIDTQELTLLYQNHDRITGWEFDWDEEVRLAYRTDENGFSEILSTTDFQNFKLIYKTNLKEQASVCGWTADNKSAYLVSNKGEVNLSTLYLMDPNDGSTTYLESDPLGKVDIENITVHEDSRKIISTSYIDDKKRRYWKDEGWKSMFEFLEQKFPDREIGISSSTLDYSKMLIVAHGDKYASDVYLFDVASRSLDFQYTPIPKLKAIEDQLASMTPVSYLSSDGLEITGYITIPPFYDDKKNLPCVVLVHGGPKGPRDYWGFNSYVQFLANRGYVVLQPNFRASGGYGKSFLNAGDMQWGRLMQDDITWGVRYLIEKGIADPKRVAIMGGSYGGYATLAGLTFTPELYACGVDIVGPSNLFTLLDSIPPYWEAGRKWLYEMTGDPETEEGKAHIEATSPLFHAKNIKRPLLIVQGANDPRVKQAESDQIVEVLVSNGHDVSYLLAMDEGHGFRKPLNKMALFVEIEQFFAKHLGGDYQKDVPEDVFSTLKSLKVSLQIQQTK